MNAKKTYTEAKETYFKIDNELTDYYEFLMDNETDEAKRDELYLARHNASGYEAAEEAYNQAKQNLILWGQKMTRKIPGYRNNAKEIENLFKIALDPKTHERGLQFRWKVIDLVMSLPE